MNNKREKVVRFLSQLKTTILERLIRVYLKGKSLPLNITVGGVGSMTNGRELFVDVTEDEADNMSMGDIAKVAKFKAYHEASHVRFTDDKEYDLVVSHMTQVWEEDAIDKGIEVSHSQLYKFAYKLLNCMCDGRIENILLNLLPGLKALRDWYRLGYYQTYDITRPRSALMEIFNNILEISTIGLYCKGFEEKYPSGDLRETIDSCIEPISRYVTSNTIKDGEDAAIEVAVNISSFVLEEFKGKGENVSDDIVDLVTSSADNSNFNKNNTSEKADNQLIIGVITDDSEEEGEESDVKPDIIIDLRKNPPKPKEEKNDSDDSSQSSGQNPESENSDSEEENSNSSGYGDIAPKEDTEEGEDSSDDASTESDESEEGEENGSETDSSSSDTESDNSDEGKEDGQDSKNSSSDNSSEADNDSQSDDTTENQSNEVSSDDKYDSENAGTDQESSKEILESLRAAADAFEKAIKERLQSAAEELSDTTAKEVKSTNAAIEASDRVSEGNNTKLTPEDESFLREEGYFSNYASNITSEKISTVKGRKLPTEIKTRGAQTRNSVQNIIASQQDIDRYDVYSGELNEAALGKFICGKGDIFKMEGEEKDPSLAVYIAKDDSGSMYGHKEDMACEALAEIEETFKPLVPLKITTFNHYRFDVIKEWDDRDNNSYTWDFHCLHTPEGGNDDALAIMNGAMQLLKRPEEKKLLIMISDGEPCCSPESVHKAVEWARKKGIFVISFFIGSKEEVDQLWPTFKMMYSRYFCGVNPKILGATLVKYLRSFIEE